MLSPVAKCLWMLMLLIVAGAGRVAAADRGGERLLGDARLERGRRGEPLVRVMVNGQAVTAMLDTGSSHTSVSDALVTTLGLRAVARTVVATSVGEVAEEVVHVDRIELAGAVMEGLSASVVPARWLDPEGRVAAVIGQDLLASGLYTLDFAAGRLLRRSRLSDADLQAALPLDDERGRFVARVPHPRGALRLVPDSGAEALILYGATIDRPFAAADRGPVWVETVSGRQEARLALVPRLPVGPVLLTNVRAAILPHRRADAATLDGLLPLTLFSRVTFDGPGHRLVLER